MFKYLEPIKKVQLSDEATTQLITKAYDYYQNRILPPLTEEEDKTHIFFHASFASLNA